jgi:huntingtin interacting protein 1
LNYYLGLPGDTLQGHRQRLNDQFRKLKRFYEQSSTLQYFKDLIKVPVLPDVNEDSLF